MELLVDTSWWPRNAADHLTLARMPVCGSGGDGIVVTDDFLPAACVLRARHAGRRR